MNPYPIAYQLKMKIFFNNVDNDNNVGFKKKMLPPENLKVNYQNFCNKVNTSKFLVSDLVE